jgi:NhaP-type Na+/H+ or K+/H+ antiporter
MGLMGSVLERLPLSPAMLYLAAGFALGPAGVGLVRVDPIANASLLTLATEVALLISLFAVGLRLRVELSDRIWLLPLRLGVTAMLVTVALLAAAAHFLLGMPAGVSLLLAAILSPTDPVLASDVQVRDPGDRDYTRFALSGEGGLNDGTAFPFVMIGLFLLGVPDAASFGTPLGLLQVLWGVAGGLASGWLMGRAVVSLTLYLRSRYRQALGMEEFLTLGLIALSYGVAHLLHAFGFLAVFAAGVAMRRAEHKASGPAAPAQILGAVQVGHEGEVATDPDKGPAYMAETILGFNEQLEHIVEFVMVLLLGIMLSGSGVSLEGGLVAALLLVVIRPVASGIALAGAPSTRLQRWLMAWFGIRGIGSLYYLMFALQYGLDSATARRIVPLVLTVLAISIMAHGISATPVMEKYHRRRRV